MILDQHGRPIGSDLQDRRDELDQSRAKYIESLRKRGLKPVLFVRGPHDGMVYTGNVMPRPGHFGCWDEEVEKLGGTVTQLIRHIYKVAFVNDELAWVFDRTEEGPACVDREMARQRPRKRKS